MIRKLWMLLIFSGISFYVYAQKQAANWYFGEFAGLQFGDCGNPPTAVAGNLYTKEGSTSISDENGRLLFYTDGITVYDTNGNILSNGENLFGDPSSAQSALIVPKPNSSNLYYIFTVDTVVGVNDSSQGFNYSIVDMSLKNGLGEIVSKNNNLLNFSSEKITSTFKNADGSSIWVITFASENGNTDSVYQGNNNYNPAAYNTFHAFEINENGINTNSIKSPNGTGNIGDRRGYLKISPNGKKIVCANTSSGTFLYDFNSVTGVISNPIELNLVDNSSGFWSSTNQGYGAEFSPNSQYLYITSWSGSGSNTEKSILFQFDLSDNNLSREIIDKEENLYRGALQLGPDGKIYRAMSETYEIGLPFLGVINKPNQKGLNCNYNRQGISLTNGSLSTQGLPPFIQSYFFNSIDVFVDEVKKESSTLCQNDVFKLDLGDDLKQRFPNVICQWYFNNSPMTGGNTTFKDNLTQAGTYRVEIDPNDGLSCNYSREIEIDFETLPIAFPFEISQCASIDDETSLFNFPEVLPDSNDPLHYVFIKMTCDGDTNCMNSASEAVMIEYFEEDKITPLSSLSNYESKAKTIWFRTRNLNTSGQCASILTPLNLKITPLAGLNPDETAMVIGTCNSNENDDNGNQRGWFDLANTDIKINLVNNPNYGLDVKLINDYEYNFYLNLEDAQLRNSSYVSTSDPVLLKEQDIFLRVDDFNSGSGCVGITRISLKINSADVPKDYSQEDLIICDTYDNIDKTSIDVQALDNLDSDAIYNFIWYNSSGEIVYEGPNNQVKLNRSGIYNYTIEKTYPTIATGYLNAITCSSSASLQIDVSEIATFNIPSFETTDLKDSNTIKCFVNGSGDYEYALVEVIDGENYEIRPFQKEEIFYDVQPGNFRVIVKDTKYPDDILNGCGRTEGLVSVIGFPRFFTPNNNGKNDFWQIKGAGLQPNSKIEIYNRYGKLLLEINADQKGWDGNYRGNPMPANDYWFKASLQDGRTVFDHFTLIR